MASYDGEEYRVARCIGQGAFGKVLLLENSNGDQVALKVVELAGKDPKVVDLTVQEICLLAKLKHEHILRFLDFKKDGSALLILTEFCRNGDLSGYISNHRGEKMDERRLVEWVRQIASALKYLHNLPKPVIHRDLKSSNVFLDANWDTRLGDFGVSRVIESSTDIATTHVGTPLYMAPEMFSGLPYTEKTDIFSLSILMYEMATMDNDFFKNLVLQKQFMMMFYPNVYHQVPTMPDGYSAGVIDLMKMMMQADPNKRPAADEILRQNVFKTTGKPSPITVPPKVFDNEDDDDDDEDTYLSSDTLTWVNLSIESGAPVGGRTKPVGRSKQEKSAEMLQICSTSTWSTDNYGQHADHGQQIMAMKQIQQAAEASKQMLYGVYGNVVSILEEYEARTQKSKAGRSNITLPDQSRKTVEDVQRIVQMQLLLFETQQRACPKEVSASVNKELRKKTIHWAAVRAEHNMKTSNTDKYICQLYEVLVKGKTKHDILDEPRQTVSPDTIRENFQHILQGKHDASQIDQQFKADEKKKANSPETRQSAMDDALHLGVNRMSETMPALFEVLASDLEEFEAEGPQTIGGLR